MEAPDRHRPARRLGVLWPGRAEEEKRDVRLEALTVEGRIQKQQAFYILAALAAELRRAQPPGKLHSQGGAQRRKRTPFEPWGDA